jgi:hypothetical protein
MSQQQQHVALRLVQHDGGTADDLTGEALARFPGNVLAALLQDTTNGQEPAVIRLSHLPASPLTTCTQALALVAGLFREGRFPTQALHSLLEATPQTCCREALNRLRGLLDYLGIPSSSSSTFLPAPRDPAVQTLAHVQVWRLLRTALADEAAALMLASTGRPREGRSHPTVALDSRMFLLVAGHDSSRAAAAAAAETSSGPSCRCTC